MNSADHDLQGGSMRNRKRTFFVLFIVAEIGFIFLLLIALASNLKLENPISINLDQTDWVDVFVGVAGIFVTLVLYKLSQKTEKRETPKIEISGGSPQLNFGKNSHNIQTQEYTENNTKNHYD